MMQCCMRACFRFVGCDHCCQLNILSNASLTVTLHFCIRIIFRVLKVRSYECPPFCCIVQKSSKYYRKLITPNTETKELCWRFFSKHFMRLRDNCTFLLPHNCQQYIKRLMKLVRYRCKGLYTRRQLAATDVDPAFSHDLHRKCFRFSIMLAD